MRMPLRLAEVGADALPPGHLVKGAIEASAMPSLASCLPAAHLAGCASIQPRADTPLQPASNRFCSGSAASLHLQLPCRLRACIPSSSPGAASIPAFNGQQAPCCEKK